MITVNNVTYSNENRIADKSTLNMALATLLGCVDFTSIATLKEHVEKVDGVKTDKVTGLYLTTQIRLPGVVETRFANRPFYTKHFAVKLDAFNIAETLDAVPAKAETPKAASISQDEILAKLAEARAYNASKPAKSSS